MQHVLRILGFFFLFLAGTPVQAQQVTVKGRIIDKKSGEPVFAATISVKGARNTISDIDGRFSLAVEKFPVTLAVSHVSYGELTVVLQKMAEEVVIRLDPRVNRIPEVRVTGGMNRVQMLNKRARYTITDYQFEGPYMWFIGFMDNSPRGGRLYLGNPYGDTICSVPAPGQVRLYRDYFGKIHLVRQDSVYQLFNTGDSIRLLFPESRSNFIKLMSSYEVAFGNGLARLMHDPIKEELSLIYIDSTLIRPKRIYLYNHFDENGYLGKRYAWLGRYFGPRTLNLMINQQRRNYLLTMRSSLFTFGDTLYVINLQDNQLHTFSTDLHENRVVPLTFYFKDSDYLSEAYMPFRIITDPLKHQAYVVFNINSHTSIFPLNGQTGQIGTEIALPRSNAMDKLSIYNNTLYYIYPEKLFPYYQRLYSMVLK